MTRGESKENLVHVAVAKCTTLRRNPQYLTRKQLDSLKRSIERDGFVAPVLVRPIKGDRYEVVSGNHRFMAAQELGHKTVPAVVKKMSDKQAQRLSVNLNMIHGNPTAQLLAPFLAELDDDILADIHLEDDLLKELIDFDRELAEQLADLQAPSVTRATAATSPITRCKCPVCGKDHIASAQKNSE